MTSERLLILIADRLSAAIQPELERYEAQLLAKVSPRLAGMRSSERVVLQDKLSANVEAYGIELALNRLRQAPKAEPKTESQLARLFPAYND
jgi:hypothetical protein